MNSELVFDGKKYISSKRASQTSGYAQDYIGQLCRGGKLDCRRIGRTWFVEQESLHEHQVLAALPVKNSEATFEAKKIAVETTPESTPEITSGIDQKNPPEFHPAETLKKPSVLADPDPQSTAALEPPSPLTPELEQDLGSQEIQIGQHRIKLTFLPQIKSKVTIQSPDASPLVSQTPPSSQGSQNITTTSTESVPHLKPILENTQEPQVPQKQKSTRSPYHFQDYRFNFLDDTSKARSSIRHGVTVPPRVDSDYSKGIPENPHLLRTRQKVGLGIGSLALTILFFTSAYFVTTIDPGSYRDVAATFATETPLQVASLPSAVESLVSEFTTIMNTIALGVYRDTNNFFNIAHDTYVVWINDDGHARVTASKQKDSVAQADTADTVAIPDESNGIVVIPPTGGKSNSAMIEQIKKTFSDDVIVSPDKSGTAGVIQPVFKNTTGDNYVYVMVPVKEKKK